MPKIIGGSLAEHREQTRTRLFDALSSLMAERGFEAITMAQIAARADVGRTVVYNYFADKEALLVAFVTHETEQYLAELERALVGISDPIEQLRVYVRHQISMRSAYQLADGPDLRTVLSRDTMVRMHEHAALVKGVLRRILTAGVDSGLLPISDVDAVVPLVHGCLAGRRAPSDADPEHAVRTAEEFVLRAVGAA